MPGVMSSDATMVNAQFSEIIEDELSKLQFRNLCEKIATKVVDRVSEIEKEHEKIKTLYSQLGEQINNLFNDSNISPTQQSDVPAPDQQPTQLQMPVFNPPPHPYFIRGSIPTKPYVFPPPFLPTHQSNFTASNVRGSKLGWMQPATVIAQRPAYSPCSPASSEFRSNVESNSARRTDYSSARDTDMSSANSENSISNSSSSLVDGISSLQANESTSNDNNAVSASEEPWNVRISGDEPNFDSAESEGDHVHPLLLSPNTVTSQAVSSIDISEPVDISATSSFIDVTSGNVDLSTSQITDTNGQESAIDFLLTPDMKEKKKRKSRLVLKLKAVAEKHKTEEVGRYSSTIVSKTESGSSGTVSPSPSLSPQRKCMRKPFKFKAGAIVYAKPKLKESDIWYEAELLREVTAKGRKLPKLHIRFMGGESIKETTPLNNIATKDAADAEMIEIGSRVVAGRPSDTVNSDVSKAYQDINSWGSVNVMFAGVVAELACPANRHRYLVFFDDGYAQYFKTSDLFLVVKPPRCVWKDVPNQYCQSFLKRYLTEYPYRKLVCTTVGTSMQTEWNGQLWKSRVLAIDGSLMKVLFHADQRSEWIYRGTERLEPLFRHLHPHLFSKKIKEKAIKKEKSDHTYIDEKITHPQFGACKFSTSDPSGEKQKEEWEYPPHLKQTSKRMPKSEPNTPNIKRKNRSKKLKIEPDTEASRTDAESEFDVADNKGKIAKKQKIGLNAETIKTDPDIGLNNKAKITKKQKIGSSTETIKAETGGGPKITNYEGNIVTKKQKSEPISEEIETNIFQDMESSEISVRDTLSLIDLLQSNNPPLPSPAQLSSPESFPPDHTHDPPTPPLTSWPPKKRGPHKCDETCVEEHKKHSRSKYIGAINYLAIPFKFGWSRERMKRKLRYRDTYYRTPCNKRLRNMEEVSRYLTVTKCKNVAIDMFCFNSNLSCRSQPSLNEKPPLAKIDDISGGKEACPIVCVNEVNDELPNPIVYINSRVPAENVLINTDPGFLDCCDCTDNCQDNMKCGCLQLTIESSEAVSGIRDGNACYQYRRLKDTVTTGIYECNANCSCSKERCYNRVVQNGIQLRLQVFFTETRGWGVRCIDDIPKGAFVCTYAGQVLNEQTANKEGMDYGDEYLAELDHIEVVQKEKEDYEADVPELRDNRCDTTETTDNESDTDSTVSSFSVSSTGVLEGNTVCSSPKSATFCRMDEDLFTSLQSLTNGTKKPMSNITNMVPASSSSGIPDQLVSKTGEKFFFPPGKAYARKSTSNRARKLRRPTREASNGHVSTRSLYDGDQQMYVIDAKCFGNAGRFLNHSCSPNLYVQNVMVDTHDLRFPWVAFFTQEQIPAFTELTWNYNYEIGSVPGKTLLCKCGAKNCKGRLL